MNDLHKMIFTFATENGEEIETMWVRAIGDDKYVVDNIPFYVKLISLNDIVGGKKNAEGDLVFDSVVTSGGHSTIRIVVFDQSKVAEVCQTCEGLKCSIEIADNKKLLAVDVPPHISWDHVIGRISSLAEAGLVDYEEASISRVHVP